MISGGRWPALAQRMRVTPRSNSSGVCSKRATAAVARVLVCSVVIEVSSPRSTSAGPASLYVAMPRSNPRSCPMAAAASVS